jgi:hypothetical protein
MLDNYLTPADLLSQFHIALSTSANWRWMGNRGPAYVKAPSGRVYYRSSDVIAWLMSGQVSR